jgi:hypothetical protein
MYSCVALMRAASLPHKLSSRASACCASSAATNSSAVARSSAISAAASVPISSRVFSVAMMRADPANTLLP